MIEDTLNTHEGSVMAELRMRCIEAAVAEQSNWEDKLRRAEHLLAWVLSGEREGE